ncbi:MAG: hypothetical protein V4819_00250 [Verrucomicrobiota bacterium]
MDSFNGVSESAVDRVPEIELSIHPNLGRPLTWRRRDVTSTDVRMENALLAESDGQIHPFDFILVREK